MGAGGCPGVTDLDEDAVALVVILAVTVGLFQEHLRVADLTSDATARHGLKVCACAKRLCAKLLQTDSHGWLIIHYFKNLHQMVDLREVAD